MSAGTFMLKCVLLVVSSGLVYSANSGLYIDNGKGQTVLERFISRSEKVKFEQEMLNFLGLPRKPRRSFNSSELDISARRFLLDIHRSLDGSKLDNEFNFKPEDLRAVKESDAIMTFLGHNNHVNNMRHEKGRRLWFDVSDVAVGDTIVGAELRLYKLYDDSDVSTQYTVSLYQVSLDYNEDKHLEFVGAVNITQDYEGWMVFNVTAPFTTWVALPSTNRGLYLSVHKRKSNHEIHPESIGIISVSDLTEVKNQQPFVVAFFKYGATSQNKKIRRIRDTPSGKRKQPVSNNVNPFATESAWSLRGCQLQTLYVNFKDLNWQDWIIAPDGYAAFYCSGLCEFPLNAHLNPTNHAIVQTLVHIMNNKIPEVNCAPTKLGPMTMLYYLEDNNVILKKYKNMVAKSCGCI